MKLRTSLMSAVMVVGLVLTSSAYAATPTFSISTSGDSAQLVITGDANAAATLFYNVGSSTGFQIYVLGTTDSSGQLSKTVSVSSLGLNTGESLYIVVNGQQSSIRAWPVGNTSTSTTPPVLSQSNVTLNSNQSTQITLQGALNSVYVLSNSNSAVATAQISGGTITVIAGSQTGSTTMTLCYNGTTSNCATLTVTVQSGGSSSGAVTFDQANPNVQTGGSLTVTILGGGNAFFVASNSNPSIMTYTLNGNAMNISGTSNGSATLSICSAINTTVCGQLYVTVGASSSSSSTSTTTTNQGVNFNPGSVSVVVNQTTNVTLSGATTYFVSVNTNPIAAQTSISGGILYVTGVAAGSTSLTVCAAGGTLCGTLPVTVTTTAVTPTPAPSPSPTPTPTPVAITANTSSAALSLTIQLMQAQLSQMLLAIQSMQAQLKQLLATVPAAASSVSTISASASLSTAPFSGKFTAFLDLNSTGAEVTALQKKLAADGYYSGPITGTFGPLTQSAVKKFQTANGLDPAGYVGPSTRAALNQ